MRMEKLQVGLTEMRSVGPDFESPIEEIFQYEFTKFGNPKLTLERQVWIGSYRVDFLVRNGNRTIVFECDGKEFHDKAKDMIRDEQLRELGVSVIYRLAGSVVFHHIHDALLLIACVEPGLFHERTKAVLFGRTTQKHSLYSFCADEFGGANKQVEVYTTSNLDPEIITIRIYWLGYSEKEFKSPMDEQDEDGKNIKENWYQYL